MGLFFRVLVFLTLFCSFAPLALLAGESVAPQRLPVINGSVTSSQWEELPMIRRSSGARQWTAGR